MTDAADLLLVDGEIHSLTDPDRTHEALAVRDGTIVRVGRSNEVEALEGVETDVIDCDGRVVLPGFVDAHTHMEQLGQHLVHADLSGAPDREACIESLIERAETIGHGDEETEVDLGEDADADGVDPTADGAPNYDDREWVLGFGYDESEWEDPRVLTREDLDRVSEDRPVVAMRVDLHTASLNSVALDHFAGGLPDADLRRTDGEPNGVAVERAAEVVRRTLAADRREMRELLSVAAEYAIERGVTGVHDKVRGSTAPRVYRELAVEGELPLRVRVDYWSDHLDGVLDVGLVTNAGSEFVRTGAIKSFSDGSFGSRTARLSEPYADGAGSGTEDATGEVAGGDSGIERGQWVVDPDDLRDVVERADAADLQLCVHAIGDEAIEETLSALESTTDPESARHRIEHCELATDDHLERMASAGIVASMQPNFLRWADEGGLYDRRIGRERRERTNRFRDVLDAGVPLAFGSDGMPLDPLLGVHHAVNAPTESQRLSVAEALRAYTYGGAYAGFDEDRLGTIEAGRRADLVVLEESPWERPDRIGGIEVSTTIVDGRVVYDDD